MISELTGFRQRSRVHPSRYTQSIVAITVSLMVALSAVFFAVSAYVDYQHHIKKTGINADNLAQALAEHAHQSFRAVTLVADAISDWY